MSLMISVSGIRGLISDGLTPQIASEFGAAFGSYLGGGLVVLGRDSRPSGPNLRNAIVASLARCGCPVIDLGIISTPGTALMVRRHQAAGGLVITASHNPSQWNGIKFLTPEGIAPPVAQAREIWKIRDQKSFQFRPIDQQGYLIEDESGVENHVAAVIQVTDIDSIARSRFKVVLDSVNGAGAQEGRALLEALGCEVVHMNSEPHGQFAHPPEPTKENLQDLCQKVIECGAAIGFAQDPDADRLAIVDELGNYIGEEYTLALAVRQTLATHPGALATNLSTSRMIDDLAANCSLRCQVYRSAVGEAHVVQTMQRHGCVLGGEGNGGVIDPRIVPVRDSLAGIALVLQLMASRQKALSQIVEEVPRYAMIKQKFPCDADKIERLLQAVRSRYADQRISDVDGIRIDWDASWVHIRGSNTEPIIRIIAEAKDSTIAQQLVSEVRNVAGL